MIHHHHLVKTVLHPIFYHPINVFLTAPEVNINLVKNSVPIVILVVPIVLVQQYVPAAYQDMFYKIQYVKIPVMLHTMLSRILKHVLHAGQDVPYVLMEIPAYHHQIIVLIVNIYKIINASNAHHRVLHAQLQINVIPVPQIIT